MKNINFFLLILIVLSVVILPGFKIPQLSLTSFYYYQNISFQLILKTDAVFLELDKRIDESSFDKLLSRFPELYVKENFDINNKKDFIFINKNLNENEIKNLINSLKENVGVINASPVFKMPDGHGNSNILIGVEKEIIAQFKPAISDSKINFYINQRGMTIVQEFDLSGGKTYLIRVPQGEYSIDYANELYLSGLVNYSEPNLFFTNLLQQEVIPNDPLFPQQWSHKNTGNNIPEGITGVPGCDMRTDSAWTITMGDSSVIVSIVDTGIDTLHEDLSGRIIHGFSINTYSNLPYAWDDNSHGTACSGIIAATGNNNLGVIGVAPQSRIFGVKIFNSFGNTNSTAIVNGLIAAWQRGSWVSSNSWGGGSPISAADNAILDGVNLGRNGKGIIWSFATGNENNSAVNWPSTNPNVITVGGISPCNQRKSLSSCDGESWWGSNYGTGLEIVSPCVKVYTTDRTGSVGYSTGNYVNNFNGTSSATPNVSGVAALVLAVDSNLTWNVVRERICLTADKVGGYIYNQSGQLGLGGWNNQMGYGKINAYEVVKLTADAIPVELTSFTANVIDNEVFIKWSTATETNNQGFEIERSQKSKVKSQNEWEKIGFVSGFGTATESKSYSFSDINISSGTYGYRLKQIDYDGTFEYSPEVDVDFVAPGEFVLNQNYPNPFNPRTNIKFSVSKRIQLKINLYNMLGEIVQKITEGLYEAGNYQVTMDAQNLPSGIYIYRIESDELIKAKKMVLMK